MNPSPSETNGLKLPTPVSEQSPVNSVTPEANPAIAETGAASAPEAAPGLASPAALPSIPLPPMGNLSANAAAQATPKQALPTTDVPAIADDTDLIEKEWVNKAKQIIDKTRNDPYQQSKEITVFKADYLKKRYNKSIKLSE